MSYRLPLATTDDPGVSTIGSGLEITAALQTTATVGAGQTLTVRSEVITGSLNVTNRSLIILLA